MNFRIIIIIIIITATVMGKMQACGDAVVQFHTSKTKPNPSPNTNHNRNPNRSYPTDPMGITSLFYVYLLRRFRVELKTDGWS